MATDAPPVDPHAASEQLPIEPARLPETVAPMFPGGASEPFDSADHLFEVRWDGLRALAFIEGGSYHLQDQAGRNMTELFPELAEVLHRVRDDRLILDGVVVVCDASGKPDFSALDRRMRVGSPDGMAQAALRTPAAYIVFDILYRDARALTSLSLLRRRRALREVLEPGGRIALSDAVAAEGEAFFEAARDLGFDAVIAKRKDSPYLPGARSPGWLLVQDVPRQDVVVVGYLPGETPGSFESLLVGVFGVPGAPAGVASYVGAVGGGFDPKTERLLGHALPGLAGGAESPLRAERVPAGAVWTRPELVVSVKFSQWSPEGAMRFPIFVGMHPEVAPRDCVRQQLMPPRARRARRRGVKLELPQLPFAVAD